LGEVFYEDVSDLCEESLRLLHNRQHPSPFRDVAIGLLVALRKVEWAQVETEK
jgi:hypothetical protein